MEIPAQLLEKLDEIQASLAALAVQVAKAEAAIEANNRIVSDFLGGSWTEHKRANECVESRLRDVEQKVIGKDKYEDIERRLRALEQDKTIAVTTTKTAALEEKNSRGFSIWMVLLAAILAFLTGILGNSITQAILQK